MIRSLLILLVALGPLAAAADEAAVIRGSEAIEAGRFAEAYEILLPEAEDGNVFAQYNVGFLLQNGFGVPEDKPAAVKWFKLAAEQGDYEAKVNLGLMYANGEGVAADPARAFALYEEAATAGVPMGQNNLAGAYLNGQGTEQDTAQAVYWYRQAALQGSPPAQNSLGILYCQGFDTPDGRVQDSKICFDWIKEAADQGYRPAMANVFGATKDLADAGDLDAMHNVGSYYLQGYGTVADPAEGIYWLTKAADRGFKHTQNVLAQLYAQGGYGITADAEKSAYWAERAGE